MALKLSLKPHERFVVNGAVIENGDRKAVLLLQNRASILREKDIMQPEDARTPARRIYLPVMMMYIEQSASDQLYTEFVHRMTEFMNAVQNQDVLAECVAVSREVMAGEFYRALSRCRRLIAYEEERLGHVHTGIPAGGEEDRKSA